MESKKLLGMRIKALRCIRKLSQEILAEKTGISSKYLSSIERGKENPTLKILIGLAKALDVDVSEFFNYTLENKSPKELRAFIRAMLKSGDQEKLKLAAKVLLSIPAGNRAVNSVCERSRWKERKTRFEFSWPMRTRS